MSTTPGVVTAVRWNDLCPWLLLVRAARVALLVRVIVLAMAGVFVTQWGWSAIERVVLGPESGVPPLVRLTEHPPTSMLQPAPRVVSRQPFVVVDRHPWTGPLVRGWAWSIQPLVRLVHAPGWRAATAFILAGVWLLAVWALIGGAIARIAALYLTRGEMLGPLAALKAAAGRWASTFAAPSFCLGVIGVFAVLLLVIGFVMRLGVLAFVAGVVWPLVLLIGVAMAVFTIGLILGWPFMWSTIAAERTDAFDGVSRGYAFAFQRPLHFAFYVLVATVLGLLAQAVVSLVVAGSLEATHWGVSRGAGQVYADALLDGVQPPDGEKLGTMARAGGKMMRTWTAALSGLATCFPMAYLWPAAMGIYLLLRRNIDSTELAEVSLDEDAPERGLPPLVTDHATGVPRVDQPGVAPVVVAAPAPEVQPPAATDPTATITELRGGPS